MTKQRVLVPNDGSEFCRQVYPVLLKFFAPEQTELVLLRVGHHPAGMVGAPPRPASMNMSLTMFNTHQDAEQAAHPIFASQEWESAEAEIRRQMLQDAHLLETAGYTVEVQVRFGDGGEEIVKYVEYNPVDVIAMTTHGRTGIQKLIFGSVAQHVAAHVSTPILMVRSD
jgi:nucleotide-binding universal stress UspA family protein